MKRILALVIVALICAAGILSAAAAEPTPDDPADNGAAIEAAGTENVQEDGIVVEDEQTVIDLRLTTTLIIVICSVFTIGILIFVVIMGKRNRG